MIDTEQTILVTAAIGSAWCYVQDIRNWASLMPGCRECTVINATDSRWMWEAVSKPLLPMLAKSFAAKLKSAIEKTASA